LVAISIQWMTVVEGCAGKSVRVYDGWRAAYAACGANYHTLVSCCLHGSVKHACVHIWTVNFIPIPTVGYPPYNRHVPTS
jgi:hypothetical protein